MHSKQNQGSSHWPSLTNLSFSKSEHLLRNHLLQQLQRIQPHLPRTLEHFPHL